MVDKALFSSNSDEWSTPQYFFDYWNKIFHFDWDAAATEENTKCELFSNDSLETEWAFSRLKSLTVWLNPPHSKIKEFIKKAYNESMEGCHVVCLVPSRTCTRWWHDYVMKADEIYLVKGRLKFGNSENSAPFPSAVVCFLGGETSTKNYGPVFSSLNLKEIQKSGSRK